MQALPDLRQMPAASAVTLGRALLKIMATTPMGTRRFSLRRPLGRSVGFNGLARGIGSGGRFSLQA